MVLENNSPKTIPDGKESILDCVPTTFVFLYFMDTNLLVANNGKYKNNELHYCLKDKESQAIIDLTEEQYVEEELQQVYATCKSANIMDTEKNQMHVFFSTNA